MTHRWVATQAEFDEVNDELGLHSLAVEDAIKGRQRAKVELYDNTVFVVLKPLRYLEESSDIETGELMCVIGDHFLVTVRRGEASPLAGLRERLEKEPALLRHGQLLPANLLNMIPARVSQALDLKGPALALRSAELLKMVSRETKASPASS